MKQLKHVGCKKATSVPDLKFVTYSFKAVALSRAPPKLGMLLSSPIVSVLEAPRASHDASLEASRCQMYFYKECKMNNDDFVSAAKNKHVFNVS